MSKTAITEREYDALADQTQMMYVYCPKCGLFHIEETHECKVGYWYKINHVKTLLECNAIKRELQEDISLNAIDFTEFMDALDFVIREMMRKENGRVK